ncbi:MAG: hypothetical protein AAF487_04395 [Bacteroidota bacterium]
MSKVAVIDIGTNTSKIHIVEIAGDQFTSIRKEKIPTKLGKGGIQNMRISDEAVQRLEDALLIFKDICIEEKCANIMAFATAMMRNSENGNEVAEYIHDKTGIAIQIIDGQEEADLIFRGVSECVDSKIGQYLIMDIGGGSTEFVLVTNGQSEWQKSFQFGATSLLEKFVKDDPVSASNIREINGFLEDELSDLFSQIRSVNIPLIGSSGTFESISEMIAHRSEKMESYESGMPKINAIESIQSLHNSIIHSNRIERSRMRGLPEFRIDTIVTALISLNFLFSKIQFSAVHTAPYSLKEGAIVKYFLGQKEQQH